MSIKKVIACIRDNKTFLVTTHTNLEGDALGSEIAFLRLLEIMGKSAIIVNEDTIPYGYEFLPEIKNIKKPSQFKSKSDYFDCLVVLDCSDLVRCGISKINIDYETILNIDHHISNKKFGDINWIEPAASSCTEMIYKLYRKLNLPLDRDTALSLYVGMLTDTGSFRYPNTSYLTHRIASELLKYDLDVAGIYRNIYENVPFSDMKLLSSLLPTLKLSARGKIAWFQIKGNVLKDKRVFFDLTESILSFARTIKNVEVAVLFKENFDEKRNIRVNLRSQGKIDVNKIAHFFGGGGHKTASGCTIKGKIEQVRRAVLNKIKESLR